MTTYDKPIMSRSPTSWGTLKQMKFTDPKYRVYPFMPDKSLTMIHSWRGVGKTYFCLALAQAVASNSPFLKWPCAGGSVFYFDCEMGEQAVQQRYAMLDRAAKYPTHDYGVHLFSFEHMGGRTWNLADPDAQRLLETLLDGVSLLIIDNLSAACRPLGREMFKEAYYRMRDWLIGLKMRGIAVLIVHHSGKEGKQRGISDIEDPLDTVIHLRRSEDWKISDGTQFEFHFEKTRGLAPTDPKTLESLAVHLVSKSDTEIEWKYSALTDTIDAKEQEREQNIKETLKKRRSKQNEEEYPF